MKIFRKNYLDEREKTESRRITSIAYWIAFWGLVISIMVQLFAFEFNFANIAGEFIVLLVCALYVAVRHARRGIDDNSFIKYSIKTYLIISLAISFLINIPAFLIWYVRHEMLLSDSLLYFAIGIAVSFVLAFGLTVTFGSLTKKRRKKLDEKYSNDDIENPE
ncbi:MAG: hypothetical protein FWD05_10840 [Oscillospiraceae bacterium]|nr:hypothetical protein [Oscillospiraceae bacterium]